MNDIQIFGNKDFGNVRAMVEGDGSVWFVAKDVAGILGYGKTNNMTKRLETNEQKIVTSDSGFDGALEDQIEINRVLQGEKSWRITLISEPGLYNAVFGSARPEAKMFKNWVFQEVIPSIRKRGVYATEDFIDAAIRNPQTTIRLLQELSEEREAKREAQEIADEAVRTKAWISDRKTATAMATAKHALDKVERLERALGENRKYASILKVSQALGLKEDAFPWQDLKNFCVRKGINVLKVQDQRYARGVNVYPAAAWLGVHGIDLEILFPRK